jgi:uncharacterized protein (TIGR02145 family)
MKKKLLLMMLCWPALLAAQNGITVSNLTVSAGTPTTVTFDVSWSKTGMPDVWSDTVWVWVDYNKNGVMERLPVTGGTATAGTVTKISSNDKGVWIAGNARSAGSFSATVKLLTATTDVAGACAYASNYPPVGEYSSDAPILSFTGTPMYEISLTRSGGESATVKAGDTFLLPCDYTPTSFTDATGAPGRLNGVPFNDNVNVPRYAASAKTWKVGNQIWSDVINIPTCDNGTFTVSNEVPYCCSYTTTNKIKYYYYNWPYVNKYQNTLCPSPWHVPTLDDFITLDLAFKDGTGKNRSGVDLTWIKDNYITAWGGSFGVGFFGSSWSGNQNASVWWSATEYAGSTSAYYLIITETARRVEPQFLYGKYLGFVVRCVR